MCREAGGNRGTSYLFRPRIAYDVPRSSAAVCRTRFATASMFGTQRTNHRLGVLLEDPQEGLGWSSRMSAALLPILERVRADPDHTGRLRLGDVHGRNGERTCERLSPQSAWTLCLCYLARGTRRSGFLAQKRGSLRAPMPGSWGPPGMLAMCAAPATRWLGEGPQSR